MIGFHLDIGLFLISGSGIAEEFLQGKKNEV